MRCFCGAVLEVKRAHFLTRTGPELHESSLEEPMDVKSTLSRSLSTSFIVMKTAITKVEPTLRFSKYKSL